MKFALRSLVLIVSAAVVAVVASHSPEPLAQAQPPRRQRPPESPAAPTVNIIRQGFPAAQADSADLTTGSHGVELIDYGVASVHNVKDAAAGLSAGLLNASMPAGTHLQGLPASAIMINPPRARIV